MEEPVDQWIKSSFSGGNGGNCVEVAWRKANASKQDGNCVEVGKTGDLVLMRDSKDPDGPVLKFTPAEWDAFRAGMAAGEFDNLSE
jgi:hypothetical protein